MDEGCSPLILHCLWVEGTLKSGSKVPNPIGKWIDNAVGKPSWERNFPGPGERQTGRSLGLADSPSLLPYSSSFFSFSFSVLSLFPLPSPYSLLPSFILSQRPGVSLPSPSILTRSGKQATRFGALVHREYFEQQDQPTARVWKC